MTEHESEPRTTPPAPGFTPLPGQPVYVAPYVDKSEATTLLIVILVVSVVCGMYPVLFALVPTTRAMSIAPYDRTEYAAQVRRGWRWFWTSLIATIALGILFFVAYFALMFGAIGLFGAGGS